ncbi:RNA polymerase sigma factor [Thalassolituus sp.]|uniref:RNA polymerase sigma factor n=1 Tax=Thalassolituus sp. TaxID=2030822 RepID=UPI00261D119F|nr:RNA polymerase sigma factor [uncultured Thalassolituus sp.]
MNTQQQVFRQALIDMLPALRRYCRALTNDSHNADDLLQASVEKALARWQQYQPGTHFERWMYRLCRNHWIDTIRTQADNEEFEEETMSQINASDTEQQVISQMALQQVQAKISSLSEGLRMVLYLVAVEGCSYQEAADILEIPTGTVMSRLARARAQLIAAD